MFSSCYICGSREQQIGLTGLLAIGPSTELKHARWLACANAVNTQSFTLKQLFDRVLRKRLCMNEPAIDVITTKWVEKQPENIRVSCFAFA